jgi:DNA (cytosine-5)-methyltransferase 1
VVIGSLRHGGLCEGYGGTTQAATAVLGPLDTRWVAEIKPAAVRLLEQRYPDVENVGDLTAVWPVEGAGGSVEPVDLVTVSWPCQPHSPAGARLGMDDPRAIWPNAARSIAETRPAIVLGENVPRVAGNGELRRVVDSLADLGYVGAWRCVRADRLGACHRRDRLWFVAVRADAADAVGEHVREQPWWGSWAGGTGATHPRPAGEVGRPGLTLLPTPCSRDGRGANPRATRNDGYARSAAQLDLPGAVLLLPTPTSRNGRGGDPRGTRRDGGGCAPDLQTVATDVERFGVYGPAIARHAAALGRSAPSPTMARVRGTGAPQLSPMFVEWMMCLPQGWVTDLDDLGQGRRAASWRSRALSLLGDGVVPAQGAWAYRDLLVHLFTSTEGK